MVETGSIPGKGRIRASIDKQSLHVPEKDEFLLVPKNGRIRASVEKLSRRVPKKRSNQCEYRKIVESGRVPGKCRIGPSIEILSCRVPEKGRISESTEKW